MYHMEITNLQEQESSGNYAQVLLDKAQGCLGACLAGITVYKSSGYPEEQVHDFQEGFYVISGRGQTLVDGKEYDIKAGDSFLVPLGVKHTSRCSGDAEEMKVFWFHSA